MATVTAQLVGGPTAVLQYAGLRWLTDPSLSPPGTYEGGLEKTAAPAVETNAIEPIDVVLLSHDHHSDNLDPAGRDFLPRARRVLTTVDGARRLGGNATGLEPWSSVELDRPDGASVTVTAVPAQHGPDGTDHLTGPVIGFVLRAAGLPSVYVSGDNAAVRVVQEIVEREGPMELAVLFAGGASFERRFDGALLTLGAQEAAQAARTLGARAVVPVHQEGWAHFSAPPDALRHAFDEAGLGDVLVAIAPGQTVAV